MLQNITDIAQISTNATYRLINSWNLSPLTIDPTREDLRLHAAKQGSPLEFQFRNSDEPSDFNICAAYGGQTWCLDVFVKEDTTPHLSPFRYYSGQYWRATPSEGLIKLSNGYTGWGYYLDVQRGSNESRLSTGDDAGQYWMAHIVAENVTLPANAPGHGSITPSGGHRGKLSSGLSQGGAIAVTIFATSVVILAGVWLIMCCLRRRRKRMRQSQGEALSPPPVLPSMSRKKLKMMESDASLTQQSTLVTSGSSHNDGFAHELESPQPETLSRSSVYELPSEHFDYAGKAAINDNPRNAVRRSFNEDELKFMAPFSPVSQASSQTNSRGRARWEEIVPDTNGEITLDGNTLRPDTMTIQHFYRENDAAARRRSDLPAMGNLKDIAYGFGGGGGMAGGVAHSYAGSVVQLSSRQQQAENETPSETGYRAPDEQPPEYKSAPEPDSDEEKDVREMRSMELEKKILEWENRSK